MTARRPASFRLAFVFLLVMLCAGLALTSSARANWVDGYKHQYQGKLEKLNTAYIGFDVKKNKKGNGKIAKLSMIAPVACGKAYGFGASVPFELKGKLKVSGNKLTVKNRKSTFKIPGGPTVKGHLSLSLKFKGKKARGTFQLSANLNPLESGIGTCTFGRLTVSAKRGANVIVGG